jgi:hypothetical protein
MKRSKSRQSGNQRSNRNSNRQIDPFRQKTNLPGQNPRQNDDPSHYEGNDESRQNPIE